MRLKEVKSEKELNEIYNSIVFALQKAMEEEVRKRSTHGGFWTAELNERSRQRKKLYVKACKSKSESDIQKHKEFKKKYEEKGQKRKQSIL